MVHKDDCLSACLESLLEMPQGYVPNFSDVEDRITQTKLANQWLKAYDWSLVVISIDYRTLESILEENCGLSYGLMFCTLPKTATPKEREEEAHVVVVQIKDKKVSVIYDPGGWGKDAFPPKSWEALGFLVPLANKGFTRLRLSTDIQP